MKPKYKIGDTIHDINYNYCGVITSIKVDIYDNEIIISYGTSNCETFTEYYLSRYRINITEKELQKKYNDTDIFNTEQKISNCESLIKDYENNISDCKDELESLTKELNEYKQKAEQLK